MASVKTLIESAAPQRIDSVIDIREWWLYADEWLRNCSKSASRFPHETSSLLPLNPETAQWCHHAYELLQKLESSPSQVPAYWRSVVWYRLLRRQREAVLALHDAVQRSEGSETESDCSDTAAHEHTTSTDTYDMITAFEQKSHLLRATVTGSLRSTWDMPAALNADEAQAHMKRITEQLLCIQVCSQLGLSHSASPVLLASSVRCACCALGQAIHPCWLNLQLPTAAAAAADHTAGAHTAVATPACSPSLSARQRHRAAQAQMLMHCSGPLARGLLVRRALLLGWTCVASDMGCLGQWQDVPGAACRGAVKRVVQVLGALKMHPLLGGYWAGRRGGLGMGAELWSAVGAHDGILWKLVQAASDIHTATQAVLVGWRRGGAHTYQGGSRFPPAQEVHVRILCAQLSMCCAPWRVMLSVADVLGWGGVLSAALGGEAEGVLALQSLLSALRSICNGAICTPGDVGALSALALCVQSMSGSMSGTHEPPVAGGGAAADAEGGQGGHSHRRLKAIRRRVTAALQVSTAGVEKAVSKSNPP